MTIPATEPASSTAADRLDGVASWLLRGPLTAVLIALAAVQLATWVPHYLTWPWFADHDVFATMAQGWDEGERPYRDLLGNNFPGTIYLFWLLGKMFGWGYTPALWAADATLVALFGLLMLAWSRRRFGRRLPGVVGYLSFLAYYLNLDYSVAAQRDWHAPCFAASALLIMQAWPEPTGRLASAFAMAVALTIRPQVVLYLPALAWALASDADREEGRAWVAILRWALALAILVGLGYLPIVADGLGTDFLRGIRLAAPGGTYNKASPLTFLKGMALQLAMFKVGAVVLAVALLAGRSAPGTRRAAAAWLLAIGFVLLYKPVSPLPHAYLAHPLMVTWAIGVAILVQLVLEAGATAPTLRLAVVLLILGLGATGRPRFTNPRASLAALGWLRRGEDPEVAPLGYAHNPDVGLSASYPWRDYRLALQYLRTNTDPDTRVANVLRGLPALTGPVARLPAFPAESIAWLYMVKHDDEPRFAAQLERTPNSVVVWSPEEADRQPEDQPDFPLRLLESVIREHYEPAARFGTIEVWRRKLSERDQTDPPG